MTSHTEIERAAFGLFAVHGFEGTTLEMIAAEVGVSRRTLFRYYASKNDIPWGQFDRTLDHFRGLLRAAPAKQPIWTTVHRAVRDFNDFPVDAHPPHAERMRLILHTPALQAHSALRYADWRRVIEEYLAERLDLTDGHPLPALVGHVSLGLAQAAYTQWLPDPSVSLTALIDEQMHLLRRYLQAR